MKGCPNTCWIYRMAVLIFAAVFLFNPSVSSLAQEPEQQLLDAVKMARDKGVVVSDELVNKMMQTLREQRAQGEKMKAELGWDETAMRNNVDLDKPPLSHVKGKEGIPFPKPEEVVQKPLPTEVPVEGEGKITRAAWSPVPYKRPGRCERNETRKVEDRDSEGNEELLADFLFIAEDIVPLDPEEALGQRVSLMPYGPQSGEGNYIRMELYKVPCLPYRMRTTTKGEYFDTGLNALKNYDSNQSGKGVLHRAMQAQLSPGTSKKAPHTRSAVAPRRRRD